jgi:hypothetical protein
MTMLVARLLRCCVVYTHKLGLQHLGHVQLDDGLHRFTENGGEDRDLLGLGEFNAEGEVLLELVDVVVGHRGKDGTSNLMDWCVLEGRSERWQAP